MARCHVDDCGQSGRGGKTLQIEIVQPCVARMCSSCGTRGECYLLVVGLNFVRVSADKYDVAVGAQLADSYDGSFESAFRDAFARRNIILSAIQLQLDDRSMWYCTSWHNVVMR